LRGPLAANGDVATTVLSYWVNHFDRTLFQRHTIQAAEKLKMSSFRGMFLAEESLFSRVSIGMGFLAESIPVPTGTRNDGEKDSFRSMDSE